MNTKHRPARSTRPTRLARRHASTYGSASVIVLISLLMIGVSTTLMATSYVMPTDLNLLGKSHLVVVATVENIESSPGLSTPATDYQFRVERVLKGFVLASDIIVRVPGGLSEDNLFYKIHGTASFQRSQRAILFLTEVDGVFRVSDMELGAFMEGGPDSSRHAFRNVSATEFGSSNDSLAAERQRSHLPRNFERFSQWLADRATGSIRPADYFLEATAGIVGTREDFTNITFGCQAGDAIARWREFDQGQEVEYKMFSGGQNGISGNGSAQLRNGVNAWNGVSASRVNLRFGGTTGSNQGGTFPNGIDRVNRVIPEDPNGIITGSFQATQGGTLAVTTTIADCGQTAPFGNGLDAPLIDADIVGQDGIGTNFLPFQMNGTLAWERIFGHELGHGIGLSHSCTNSCSGAKGAAIMRANYVDSLQGAALGSDDKAGVRATYPAPTGGGSSPTPPSALTALAMSTTEINLNWTDNSNNETGFVVQERAIDSIVWTTLTTLGAGSTAVIVEGIPERTARVYRVQAVNNNGGSAFSNEAQATTNAQVAPCASNATTLCIGEAGRFQVTTRYLTSQGQADDGDRVDLTDDTGYFFFFDAANVELVVKVLDACVPVLGNHFWVFAGGLTNVQVELTVTDTQTGSTKTYFNQLNEAFEPVQDTAAFSTCP